MDDLVFFGLSQNFFAQFSPLGFLHMFGTPPCSPLLLGVPSSSRHECQPFPVAMSSSHLRFSQACRHRPLGSLPSSASLKHVAVGHQGALLRLSQACRRRPPGSPLSTSLSQASRHRQCCSSPTLGWVF
jgi:hypothetical protein